METLIELYERRLEAVLEELDPIRLNKYLNHEMLFAKESCYRTIIAELKCELIALKQIEYHETRKGNS